MPFGRSIRLFLFFIIMCGTTKTVIAGVNTGNCKPFLLKTSSGTESDWSVYFTNCQGQTYETRGAETLAVKAGSTVVVYFKDKTKYEKKSYPIGIGMTISCSATRNPPQLQCNLPQSPPQNCQPIGVIYDNAHYYVNIYYTPCGHSGSIYQPIHPNGGAVMAQNGTEVMMGPQSTWTKNYLNYDYKNNRAGKTIVGGNGLNIKCWGNVGAKSTGCATY